MKQYSVILSTDKPFNLIFITDDPDCAALVTNAGVDRVMVDLEINGKIERQGNLNTVISRHLPESVYRVRERLDKTDKGEVLVRVNPLHSGSRCEVDKVIELGAQRLMLPMFRAREEVQTFIDLVGGRLPVTLLVETAGAYKALEEILEIDGEYDVHIGLNDLHLDLGLTFMFELFTNGVVDNITSACRKAGRVFGIGGVAPVSKSAQLSPLDILSYHKYVGSNGVILSRDWRSLIASPDEFSNEICRLRSFMSTSLEFERSTLDAGVSAVLTAIERTKTK